MAVHSVNTTPAAETCWCEFRVQRDRRVTLYQQGHLRAPGFFRWMASPRWTSWATSASAILRRAAVLAEQLRQRTPAILADSSRSENDSGRVRGPRAPPSPSGRSVGRLHADSVVDQRRLHNRCVGDYVKRNDELLEKIGAFRLPGCGSKPDRTAGEVSPVCRV